MPESLASLEVAVADVGDHGATALAAALLESVNAAYTDALEDLTFSAEGEMKEKDSAGNETGRYRHHYRQNIADTPFEMTSRAKAKRLNHELRGLAKPGTLPAAAEGCAFVVKDEARSDVLKVLISGPSDVHDVTRETPYGMGLFLFDFFCPAEYPEKAPVVNLMTTGDGLVRFNPNLYSDGKVCLSLIGTFNSGNSTEKWDPARSSIYQVLMGIQNQILEKYPIVNEPGYDGREDSKASRELNAKLRLLTIRHAMVDQLKAPPAGLEGAVLAHFRTQRRRILRQCWAWTEEAPVELRGKMRAAVAQLHAVLPKAE